MATYVLVHGAWHGGWCWARVARRLRAAGHEVFTPTLTGLGERAHLAGPDIALDTHITDVLAHVEAEELDDFILVGHSYGGMVVTGVADRLAGSIPALVYLDAYVPEDGQSMFSLQPPERAEESRRLASEGGDGWRIPPRTPEYFGVRDPADADWMRRRCVDQPIATFGQPVSLTGAVETIPRRVYILAQGHPNSRFGVFAERLRDQPGWEVHTVACGHEVMLEMPAELSEILLALV